MRRSIPHRPAQQPVIGVVGDLMLDRYTWGDVNRISPEAPVPILSAAEDEIRLGGAANVAAALAGLECQVKLFGVLGNDSEGRQLRSLLETGSINSHGVLESEDRPTTCKHRFMGRSCGRQPHQLLRVDRESIEPLDREREQHLITGIREAAPELDALLISDYGKGVCTDRILAETIRCCRDVDTPVLVDPSRYRNFRDYAGATLLKPNRLEADAFLNRSRSSKSCYQQIAASMLAQIPVDQLVITLDVDGMVVAEAGQAEWLHAHRKQVSDITGAGDVVFAVLGYGAGVNWPLQDAARLANRAASLSVQRLGATQISWPELEALASLGPTPEETTQKILNVSQVSRVANERRAARQTIVFTNGCFDLFHLGHLKCLEACAALGDCLIVAVNSDMSVRQLKGPTRPIVPEHERVQILAGLACVDYVVVFDEATPHRLLQAIRPDVLAKGGTTAEIVGRQLVELYGGRVQHVETVDQLSTSQRVDSIVDQVHSTADERKLLHDTSTD